MPRFAKSRIRLVLLVGLVTAAAASSAAAAPASALSPIALSWSGPTVIAPTEANLRDLSCPSSSFCAATDLTGDVLTSSNPAGGASAWKTTHISSATPDLIGVSCPSTSFCAIAAQVYEPPEFIPHSEILTSTNPTGGASAWHSADLGGEKYLRSISCPTAGFCAVVSESIVEGEPQPRNELLTSTNPTGGPSAWQTADIDPGNLLNSVECPTTGLCVAVDNEGNELTSTNPTGGAGTWSAPQAVGFRVNGKPVALNEVSCVGVSFCAASDGYDYVDTEEPGAGNVVMSFDPTGGAGTWTASPAIADGLFGISCPLAGYCLSADYSGNAYSVASAGGSSEWTTTNLEPVNYFRQFTGVACPSSERCYLLDNQGNLFVGTSSGPQTEEEDETTPAPIEETPTGGTGSTSTNTSAMPKTDGIDPPIFPPPHAVTSSSTQLAALLRQQLVPHGKAATLRSILKHGGLTMPFTVPEAGTLSVGWYLTPSKTAGRSAKATSILIAYGKLTLSAAGAGQIEIILTATGRHRLKLRGGKRIKLAVRATFSVSGGSNADATAGVTLGR